MSKGSKNSQEMTKEVLANQDVRKEEVSFKLKGVSKRTAGDGRKT